MTHTSTPGPGRPVGRHSNPGAGLAAALVAAALTLTCAACTVGSYEADRQAEAAQDSATVLHHDPRTSDPVRQAEIEAEASATALHHDPRTGKVTLDLRTPPTHASVGMPPGRRFIGITHDAGTMLDVDIAFPDGAHLRVPAFNVTIVALEPGSTPSISVNRGTRDLDDAGRILREQATPLRLDRDKLNILLGQIQHLPPEMHGKGNFRLKSRLPGYPRLTVELNHDTWGTNVTYLFDWDDFPKAPVHSKTPTTRATVP